MSFKHNSLITLAVSLLLLGNMNSCSAQVAESSGKVNGDVYGQIKVIGDVDGDGCKDLVFGGTDGKVHLYSAAGNEIFRPPYWPAQLDAPIVSDVEVMSFGGSSNILVTTMSGSIFCLDSLGKTKWANTDACKSEHSGGIDVIDTVRTSGPVVFESNGMGSEIAFSTSSGRVMLLDSNGITTQVIDAGGAVEGAPILADIDKDGVLDVAVKNNNGKMTVLNRGTGETFEWNASRRINDGQWPYCADACDINGDGIPEFVTTDPGAGSKVSIWSPDGKKISDFGITEGSHSAPQIADMDGDGVDDFIITQANGEVIVCDKTGKVKKGWPYRSDLAIIGAPQIIDIDGDGYNEIVFTAANINGKEDMAGCVIALNKSGKVLDEYPKYIGKSYSKPTFADLDNDGYLEMIVAGGIGFTGNQIHIFRTKAALKTKIAVIWQETLYK